MKAPLSDLSVRALKAPARGQTTIWDKNSPLGIRISAGGTKTYIVLVGSGKRKAIGSAGVLSLAEARAEAKRILAEKTLGLTKKVSAVNFETAVALFLEDNYKNVRGKRTKSEAKRLLEKHFVPPFRKRPLLAESGLVEAVRAHKAKKSPVRLPTDEVLKLVPQLLDAVTPPETAARLGVHQQALPALASRNLIEKLEGPVLGFLPGRAAYSCRSVDKLIRNIWKRVIAPVPQSAVRLAQVARHLTTEEAPWDAIISSILAGDTVVYGNQKKRGRLESLAVVDSGDFARAVQKHLRTDRSSGRAQWIGVGAAGEILKTGPMIVSLLARKRPDILNAKKAGYDPYLRDDVLKVAKKYIFVPEIRAGKRSK